MGAAEEKLALQDMIDVFETLSDTYDVLFDCYAKGQTMKNLAAALEALLDLCDTQIAAWVTTTAAC